MFVVVAHSHQAMITLHVSLANLVNSSFFQRPSTIAVLWLIIYSSDWLMNYWGTRLYNDHAKRFCVLEGGYPWKRITERDLFKPKKMVFRYFSELLISTVTVWLFLYICRLYSSWRIYAFLCGAFILLEACIHFRHLRTVTVLSLMKPESGIRGTIAIPLWLDSRLAFIEFGAFTSGFLILFCFDSTNYFVLGGTLACMLAMLYNYRLSEIRRKKPWSHGSEKLDDPLLRPQREKTEGAK